MLGKRSTLTSALLWMIIILCANVNVSLGKNWWEFGSTDDGDEEEVAITTTTSTETTLPTSTTTTPSPFESNEDERIELSPIKTTTKPSTTTTKKSRSGSKYDKYSTTKKPKTTVETYDEDLDNNNYDYNVEEITRKKSRKSSSRTNIKIEKMSESTLHEEEPAPPLEASPPSKLKYTYDNKELAEEYIQKKQNKMYQTYHETDFDIYLVAYTTLLKAQSVMDEIKQKIHRLLGEECRSHMPWFTSLPPFDIPEATSKSSDYGSNSKEEDCYILQNLLDAQIEVFENLTLANKQFRQESRDYRKQTTDFHQRYSEALRKTLGNYSVPERDSDILKSYHKPSADSPISTIEDGNEAEVEPEPETQREEGIIRDEENQDDLNSSESSTLNTDEESKNIIIDDTFVPYGRKRTSKPNMNSKHRNVLNDHFVQLLNSETKPENNSSLIKARNSNQKENELDGERKRVKETKSIISTATTAASPTTEDDFWSNFGNDAEFSDQPPFPRKKPTAKSPTLTERLEKIDQLPTSSQQIEMFHQIINETIQSGLRFNPDIFKVASYIKNSRLALNNTNELKHNFPRTVQSVVWADTVKIKFQINTTSYKLFGDKENHLKSQKMGENLNSNLDGDSWKFLPLRNGDSFALFNTKIKAALAVTIPEYGKQPRMSLENIINRDMSMLPSSFGWKLSLICDPTVVREVMKEKFETLLQVGIVESGSEIDQNGEPIMSSTMIEDENCPQDAWLITMDNQWKTELALDFVFNGTVYLGEAGNSGRFQIFT